LVVNIKNAHYLFIYLFMDSNDDDTLPQLEEKFDEGR
jgi:hypothetical protein